jgi:hypothetical protein
MEVQTRFGLVRTREFASRLQRSHSILLHDNPQLKPLFDWLRNIKASSIEEIGEKFPRLGELATEIRSSREVKFYLDDEVPMLVFHNIVPLEGDFGNAVPQYINLLYSAMYSPDGVLF